MLNEATKISYKIAYSRVGRSLQRVTKRAEIDF